MSEPTPPDAATITGQYEVVVLPAWTTRLPDGEHADVWGRLGQAYYQISADGVTVEYHDAGHIRVHLDGAVQRGARRVFWDRTLCAASELRPLIYHDPDHDGPAP